MSEKFNTAAVQSMLGIKITAEFIVETLGVLPAETDKRAMFWTRKQVRQIADKLGNNLIWIAARIESGEINPTDAPPKPSKKAPAPAPAAASAADMFDEDDEEL